MLRSGLPGTALQARTENPPAPTVWVRVTTRVALTGPCEQSLVTTGGWGGGGGGHRVCRAQAPAGPTFVHGPSPASG